MREGGNFNIQDQKTLELHISIFTNYWPPQGPAHMMQPPEIRLMLREELALENSFRFRAGPLPKGLSRDLSHSLGLARIKSLRPLLLGQQSQKAFPLHRKTTGTFPCSEVPSLCLLKEGQGQGSHSSNHVCGFCSSVGTDAIQASSTDSISCWPREPRGREISFLLKWIFSKNCPFWEPVNMQP